MQNLTINQIFFNSQDLRNSGLLNKWYDNFGMTHIMDEKVSRMDKLSPTYYITKADPVHNYGLDFNIYVSYKVDGINFLKQMCTTSSLTNNALVRVKFENGQISFGNEGYSKGPENRRALRVHSDAGWVFA